MKFGRSGGVNREGFKDSTKGIEMISG